MKEINLRLFACSTCFYPSWAFASGSDLIILFWLEFAVFVLVIGSIFIGKLNQKAKGIVFIAYLVGAAIPWYITQDWPYTDNLFKINTLCISIPLVFWMTSYLVCSKKFG